MAGEGGETPMEGVEEGEKTCPEGDAVEDDQGQDQLVADADGEAVVNGTENLQNADDDDDDDNDDDGQEEHATQPAEEPSGQTDRTEPVKQEEQSNVQEGRGKDDGTPNESMPEAAAAMQGDDCMDIAEELEVLPAAPVEVEDEAMEEDPPPELESNNAHKEPEKEVEHEKDSPSDERERLSESVEWSKSTLNVLPTCEGRMLMTLCEGGFQYLLAAARASVAVVSGRYMFEVKIVEVRMPLESSGNKVAQQFPQQLLRVGITDGESSLFLSDDESGSGFDSEGNFICGVSKAHVARSVQPFEVLAVVINRDPDSSNAETLSLFRDGVRACQPKPIPESMKGKPLFPTVNYRNMTLHVNFGPTPLAPLPFSCRMLQDAAKSDVHLVRSDRPAQSEVVLPVGLPDEGTFDWLDAFLQSHPDYIEVSDRAILQWAQKSGLTRPRGFSHRSCNDRPGMEFGIREMDDLSVRRLIRSVAPVLKRRYIVMEVRNNLLIAQRKKLLEQFQGDFKKTAIIAVGEPPEEYKRKVHEALLAKKREIAAETAKAEHGTRRGGVNDTAKDGEQNDSENGVQKLSLEEAVAAAVDSVKLNDDDKKQWFSKGSVSDLTAKDLGNSFASFSLPDRSEGFDEIRYVWRDAAGCAEYMKKWIAEHKLTQRVEDLQPGQWFHDLCKAWDNRLSKWQKIHSDFKDGHASRRSKARTEERRSKGRETDDAKPNSNEKLDEDNKEPKEGDGEGGQDKADGREVQNIDVADMDPFLVDDVCNANKDEPLFSKFAHEDWEMLKLRFEIHAIVHAFKKDLNDEERPSFHESHLPFYYNKYLRNSLNLERFGVKSVAELVELLSDTVEILSNNQILQSQLSEDTPLDILVRLTEFERRRRQRLIDAGDESAVLNIQRSSTRDIHSGRHSGGYRESRGQQRGHGGYSSQSARSAVGATGGNYSSRGPANSSRGPTSSRGPPPSSGASQGHHGASKGYSGGSSGYSQSRGGSSSHHGASNYGGGRSYGTSSAPTSRGYGSAPAPSSRSYGASHGASYGGSSAGAQKRPYPSSNNAPANKYSRGTGSYGGSGGSSRSYGGQGGRYGR
jgi:hypothetical protein